MFTNDNKELATITHKISPVYVEAEMSLDDTAELNSFLGPFTQLHQPVAATPVQIKTKQAPDRKDAMFQLISKTPTSVVTVSTVPTAHPLTYPTTQHVQRVRYEKNKDVVMFKTKDIKGVIIVKGQKQRTCTFRTDIGIRKVFGYSFMFLNDYFYVLMESEAGPPLLHSAKNYPGYSNVTKNELAFAIEYLYSEQTDMHSVYLPPNIQKYVNFHAVKMRVEDKNPAEMLNEFRHVVLEWNFDLTETQLQNIFLRKVGIQHQDFVHNSKHIFAHMAAVTRLKRTEFPGVNGIADLAKEQNGPSPFEKRENELYTLFVSKNIEYYRHENIDHLFIDGTGSLPRPYSQIINISFYDALRKCHHFLGCFVLKGDHLIIDLNTWTTIIDAIDEFAPFTSVSVDNERNLVQSLHNRNKQVWGCHFHYSKNIAKHASTIKKKVRIEFYHVAKHFMFMDDPQGIFEALGCYIKGRGERVLYNYIKKNYVDPIHFEYQITVRPISREIAARFTTSPVEGINSSLKKLLKKDNSSLSIYQFIQHMSTRIGNAVKPKSVFQRLDIDSISTALFALSSVSKNLPEDALITKYKCNNKRKSKYQSQKERTDRQHEADLKDKRKAEKLVNIAKQKKERFINAQKLAIVLHGRQYVAKYKTFALIKQEANFNKQFVLAQQREAFEMACTRNAELAYGELAKLIFANVWPWPRNVRKQNHATW